MAGPSSARINVTATAELPDLANGAEATMRELRERVHLVARDR